MSMFRDEFDFRGEDITEERLQNAIEIFNAYAKKFPEKIKILKFLTIFPHYPAVHQTEVTAFDRVELVQKSPPDEMNQKDWGIWLTYWKHDDPPQRKNFFQIHLQWKWVKSRNVFVPVTKLSRLWCDLSLHEEGLQTGVLGFELETEEQVSIIIEIIGLFILD